LLEQNTVISLICGEWNAVCVAEHNSGGTQMAKRSNLHGLSIGSDGLPSGDGFEGGAVEVNLLQCLRDLGIVASQLLLVEGEELGHLGIG
jgi:hypothetical protein